MCGISGVISREQINRDRFEQMTDLVVHRGPDDRGTWYDDHVALGHRRLSILDLSEAGHQPFVYKDRYILTYNGEIYNYIELKDELAKLGYEFKTTCDTEVLIASYDHWGEECVQHFNGMWAFAVYDTQQQKVFCSRDRYGVKPFYYSNTDRAFIFGSEIKQILHMLSGQNRPNKDRVLEYLAFGWIDRSEETMFDGVLQLLPGHNLIYHLTESKYDITQYYNAYEHISGRKNRIGYRKACKEFLSYYRDAIKLRLRSDVTLGFCLSGGLDSSANVCVARLESDEIRQETVTYCSTYEEYDEQEYADEIIRHTGCVSHKTSTDMEGLMEDLDSFIWHNDEPFGSSSIYASWATFKEAKKNNLTVMIDGQGADEQLAGYIEYFPVYFVQLLRERRFVKYICEVVAYYAKRYKSGSYWSKDDIIIRPIKIAFGSDEHAKASIAGSADKKKSSPFTDEQIDKLFKKSYTNPYKDMEEYKREDFRGLTALLHCEDRMTMAHSIESRLPFLDYRLVDMVGGFPMSYKIRRGMTKAVMRDSLKGILPDKVRTRISKFGFVTPEDQWINSSIERFDKEMNKAAQILSENAILDYDRVIAWWDEQKGNIKRGYRLPWRIVCVAHWMKVFKLGANDPV